MAEAHKPTHARPPGAAARPSPEEPACSPRALSSAAAADERLGLGLGLGLGSTPSLQSPARPAYTGTAERLGLGLGLGLGSASAEVLSLVRSRRKRRACDDDETDTAPDDESDTAPEPPVKQMRMASGASINIAILLSGPQMPGEDTSDERAVTVRGSITTPAAPALGGEAFKRRSLGAMAALVPAARVRFGNPVR
jgi:hypothetical protein